MPDTVTALRRSPAITLARELLAEQQPNLVIVAALLGASLVLKQFFPASNGAQALVFLLVMNAYILTFYAFTRTESNPRRDRRGFPARFFTLPVSTLVLVSVPLVLGVAAIEAVFAWTVGFSLVLEPRTEHPVWAAFKTGAFMLTYQMLIWCAARLGALRLVIIGISSFVFIVLPYSATAALLLALWCAGACVSSWIGVDRQRSGAGGSSGPGALFDLIGDALPRRSRPFKSMQGAQVWYEWRKVGYLLPMLVGVVLLLIVLPVTLLMGPERSFGPLVFTLLLPVLLAAPVGKAFSKADTWSMDTTVAEFADSSSPLGVPAFLATKPLKAETVVIAKLHAAALSTVLAWLQVFAFVALWQFNWANKTNLANLGRALWAIQNHSLVPQLAMAALFAVLLVLLTWRFMVAGLWIGLSGNGRLFTVTTVPLVLIPTAGLLLLDEFIGWLRDDTARIRIFAWCVGALVAAKFWLAAFAWRRINRELTHRYLTFWTCGTCCTLGLAILAAEPASFVFAIELPIMRSLLLFGALLVVPLAQIGFAPAKFAANRHR
jgi:hypothetical protein